MKKYILNKNSWRYFSLLSFMFITILFVSCEDDTSVGGEITINKVFLEDVNSTVQDREVSFVRLFQLIRIEGSGFTGLKKVYINGFDTFFNVAYVSDNSMIIRVSDDTPTTDAEESVRNTIRFVNDNFETIFSFEVRAAAPTITNISNTLPNSGEEITVYGTGLLEVTKVIFPGNVEVTTGITFDEEDGEFFTVTVPSGVSDDGGSILIETPNGGAYSPAYFNFKPGLLLNFDGAGTLGEFGDTITQDELQSTSIGEGNVSQGNYVYHGPTDSEPFAAGTNRDSEVFTSGGESWRTQFATTIPPTTPLDEVGFQFDVFVPEPWEGSGFLQILLINNFNGGEWTGGTYNYVPWIVDGEVEAFQTTGWTTVTIPFTDFYSFSDSDTEFTFEDVLALREGATYKNFGFFFNNTDVLLSNVTGGPSDVEFPSSATSVSIYTDNWRIVSLEVPTLSDFPE
ncbi:hypothetical protein SAMN05428642_102624 [Flaviramulus basaltis]|uniref:Surface glycan-binding protein B xyloglucan binding domain-containing protein n=1 Tax=Flaviramulus basaltis TaxID=369401 RepID=A0A1K2IKS8_9FLAO|nr:glycan-binding surface protein [Flaviramulus basaltis]SFZ92267.1 hypothetical protein SAMN05428642_102624 [Flaviramulus basaltis]